jgi:hypothetical protein
LLSIPIMFLCTLSFHSFFLFFPRSLSVFRS